MSEKKTGGLWYYLAHVWTALFIAVKLGGTSFAGWSWWWLLMPLVPALALVVKHFGL